MQVYTVYSRVNLFSNQCRRERIEETAMNILSSVSERGRLPLIYVLIALLCLLLAGCNVNIAQDSTTANSVVTTSNTSSGVQGVQVFVEPDAGYRVITNAISGAKQSVWVEMYLLTERHIIQGLEEAAHRGVDVRV